MTQFNYNTRHHKIYYFTLTKKRSGPKIVNRTFTAQVSAHTLFDTTQQEEIQGRGDYHWSPSLWVSSGGSFFKGGGVFIEDVPEDVPAVR